MKRMLGRFAPRIVIILSVAVYMLCLEYQHSRRQPPQKAMRRPVVAPVVVGDVEDSVVDTRQIHAFAALCQLCPSGELESLELKGLATGAKPMLEVVIVRADGSIVTVHVLVEGLRVAKMQDGIIVLKKGDFQSDAETF